MHPLSMGPDMLDTTQFKKGESSVNLTVHLGSVGKYKAKKKTLIKKMNAIVEKVKKTKRDVSAPFPRILIVLATFRGLPKTRSVSLKLPRNFFSPRYLSGPLTFFSYQSIFISKYNCLILASSQIFLLFGKFSGFFQ